MTLRNFFIRFFGFKKSPQLVSAPVRCLGCLPDKSDERDYLIGVNEGSGVLLPADDVIRFAGPVRSQGLANSCVAYAAALCFEVEYRRVNGLEYDGSESQLYFDGRKLGGLFPGDEGMYPRDAFKVLQKSGLAPEKLAPYDDVDLNVEPSLLARSFESWFKIKTYLHVVDLETVKSELAGGHAVFTSLPVVRSFLVTQSDVPEPLANEVVEGFHAVALVGYDDDHLNPNGSSGAFLLQNSWGGDWGVNGRAWLPYVWGGALPGWLAPRCYYTVRL